jgi:hypothetical protein
VGGARGGVSIVTPADVFRTVALENPTLAASGHACADDSCCECDGGSRCKDGGAATSDRYSLKAISLSPRLHATAVASLVLVPHEQRLVSATPGAEYFVCSPQ